MFGVDASNHDIERRWPESGRVHEQLTLLPISFLSPVRPGYVCPNGNVLELYAQHVLART